MSGTFTVGGTDPAGRQRESLSFDELCDVLRAVLDGGDVPQQWASANDLLGDINLVGGNDIRRAQDQAATARERGRKDAIARSRAWQLVLDSGKRKTMLVADLRAALTVE